MGGKQAIRECLRLVQSRTLPRRRANCQLLADHPTPEAACRSAPLAKPQFSNDAIDLARILQFRDKPPDRYAASEMETENGVQGDR